MGAIKNLQIQAHDLARQAEGSIEELGKYYDGGQYGDPASCNSCGFEARFFMEQKVEDGHPCPECGDVMFTPLTHVRHSVLHECEVLADKVLELVLRAAEIPDTTGDWDYEHEVYTREGWGHEAWHGDTQLGYHAWVRHQVLAEEDSGE